MGKNCGKKRASLKCKYQAKKNKKQKTKNVYIASNCLSYKPKRFIARATKLKEHIYNCNNQINSTVTTKTWDLSIEWTTTWPTTGLGTVCLDGY